jgi:hypothetical protein
MRDAFVKAGRPIHDHTWLAKAAADGLTPAHVPDIVAQWRKAREAPIEKEGMGQKKKPKSTKPRGRPASPEQMAKVRAALAARRLRDAFDKAGEPLLTITRKRGICDRLAASWLPWGSG